MSSSVARSSQRGATRPTTPATRIQARQMSQGCVAANRPRYLNMVRVSPGECAVARRLVHGRRARRRVTGCLSRRCKTVDILRRRADAACRENAGTVQKTEAAAIMAKGEMNEK